MSPDGKHIVYQSSTGGITGRRLYVRHLDQPEVTMLKGTERAQSPFFSPDGQWVGFVVTDTRTMRKVPVLGGPAVPIADLPDDIPRGISWGADDSIVFATSSSKGLRRVSALGGKPEVLTEVSPEEGTETDHWWPEILPNGKGVLFTAWSGSDESSRIAVVSLEDRKVTYLVSGGSHPQSSPTGHIVYGADGHCGRSASTRNDWPSPRRTRFPSSRT